MNKWFKTSEVLPEFGQMVFVATPEGVVQGVAFCLDASEDLDAAWWESWDQDGHLYSVNTFSQWIQLQPNLKQTSEID